MSKKINIYKGLLFKNGIIFKDNNKIIYNHYNNYSIDLTPDILKIVESCNIIKNENDFTDCEIHVVNDRLYIAISRQFVNVYAFDITLTENKNSDNILTVESKITLELEDIIMKTYKLYLEDTLKIKYDKILPLCEFEYMLSQNFEFISDYKYGNMMYKFFKNENGLMIISINTINKKVKSKIYSLNDMIVLENKIVVFLNNKGSIQTIPMNIDYTEPIQFISNFDIICGLTANYNKSPISLKLYTCDKSFFIEYEILLPKRFDYGSNLDLKLIRYINKSKYGVIIDIGSFKNDEYEYSLIYGITDKLEKGIEINLKEWVDIKCDWFYTLYNDIDTLVYVKR